MIYLFVILWIALAFQTQAYFLSGGLGILLILTYVLCQKKDFVFNRPKLPVPKAILNLSFWACSALCLLHTAEAVCLSCRQSVLSQGLTQIYDTSVMGLLRNNMRFCILFALAVIWLCIMLFTRKGKKC